MALGIFLVVTAAVVPQLVVGLRASAAARDITQTKGVAQARLEVIRDLPFYVGKSAGDFKDVLDTYYPDMNAPTVLNPPCASATLTALPPLGWTGYVSGGVSGTVGHCQWEPTGPLYRKVINPVVSPGLGVFSMVVSTQFLSGATPPVAVPPIANYDTKTSEPTKPDTPAASQLGVTVAVFYPVANGFRSTVTYTQVERANPMAPLLTSEAEANTLRVSSALNADTNLLEQLGVINLSGELFSGSRAITTASAASAGTSLGEQITGAVKNLVAPVDTAASSVTESSMALPSSSCSYLCFGGTKVDQASAKANNGLPSAGTSTAPVRAMIPDGANNDGFRFSNGLAGNRLKLDPSKPMFSLDTSVAGTMPSVSGCAATGPDVASYLTGTGFLDATNTSVTACATAQSNTVRIFPTNFAPEGILKISLTRATASCKLTKPAASIVATASADYAATVSYYNGAGYTALPVLTQSNATDPLTVALLGQSVGDGLTLGDYISSWKSLVDADITKTTTAKTAEVSLPGAITLITRPTREGVAGGEGPYLQDPASAISFTIGAVSCSTGDYR